MNSDLQGLYGKYLSYSQNFQDDFDRQIGNKVRDAQVFQISFVDFCDIWHRWETQGIQDHWRQRIECGYAR